MGNAVASSSLENRLVEEGGIPISFDSPSFFVSLSVENFLFS